MNRARVLIVEDQLIVAEDFAKLLEESGHEVIGICETGNEALKTALQASPDLVMVDIQLRGAMDGIETVHLIKAQLDPAIVYLTAHSEKRLFERAKETEPDGYLYKPVSPLELNRTVEIVLFKKEMERRLGESEQRYRTLVEDSFDGIFVQKETEIVFANSRLHEMLGYEPGELIGKDHWIIYQPQHQKMVRERAQARMRGESVIDEYEVKLQSKDGALLEGEIRAKAVLFEGEIGVQVWVRDITDQRQAQDEIRLLGEAIEQSHEGIAVVTLDGNIIFLNSAFADMHGYSPDELKGTHLSVFHTKEQMPEVEAANRLIQETGHFKGEIWHVRRDGTPFPTMMNNSLLRDQQDDPIGMVGTMLDISELKKTEELLQIEKEHFQTLIENAPFGLVIIDQDGSFRYANCKFLETFGYSLEEVPNGRQWFRKAFPDPRLRREAISAWVEDLRESQTGEQRPRIFTVRCKDGRDRVIHFRPVQLPAGHHFMTCEDITERWQAEEAMRESEDRYRDLVENVDNLVCTHDLRGNLLFVNQASAAIMGYSRADLVGTDMRSYLAPEVRDQFDAYLVAIQRDGQASGIMLVQTKSGGKRIWEYRNTLRTEGLEEPIVRGLARDITDRKRMEAALRESEQMFRLLSEQSLISIAILQGGVYKYANEAMSLLLDYSLEEILAWSPDEFLKVVHPDDPSFVRQQARYKQEGHPDQATRYSFRILTKSGAMKWVEIYSKTVQFRNHPANLITMLDITDRRRAEGTLAEREQQFRGLFEYSRDAIMTIEPPSWKYILANPAAMRIFKIKDMAELSSLNPADLSPELQPDGRASVEKAVERIDAAMREGYHFFEWTHKRLDGEEFLATVSVVKMEYAGKVVLQATIQDITDRKRAEEALKESEQRYRSLFEESIDGVYSVLGDGEITDANSSFCKLFGYTREEMIGKDIRELYSDPADLPRFENEIAKKGFVKDYGVKFIRKDGRELDCLLTSSVHYGKDGSIVGYRGIMRDVTDQLLLQRQLLQAHKMEAIGTLAGGIAHDVNNLLQAVLGYSDLLIMRKGPKDPDRKKLEVIQKAARDGADLVSRILTFSRKGESKKRPIDLNHEIRRVEELLRRTLPRMIQIDLVLADDLGIIDADPAQIEQVLLNLGINAQHAMPDGGRLLIETTNVSLSDEYLRTHLAAKKGKYVVLTISDTGIGMKSEVLDRIFEPFFTTKTNGLGTGLGLAMVHGIVEQHGGYIRCYSEPGMGTSFKIYFPVSASELIADLTLTRVMPVFGTETILLVDDDERVREMAQEMIQAWGYQVLMASSGEEALEMYAIHGNEISLIILDLIMPGMGGQRCLQELLSVNPDVRILLASGYSENSPAVGEKGLGARGFLNKPYGAKDILTAIRRILDKGHL